MNLMNTGQTFCPEPREEEVPTEIPMEPPAEEEEGPTDPPTEEERCVCTGETGCSGLGEGICEQFEESCDWECGGGTEPTEPPAEEEVPTEPPTEEEIPTEPPTDEEDVPTEPPTGEEEGPTEPPTEEEEIPTEPPTEEERCVCTGETGCSGLGEGLCEQFEESCDWECGGETVSPTPTNQPTHSPTNPATTVNPTPGPTSHPTPSPTTVPDIWINEFHYDNLVADIFEFVEVAGPAGAVLDDCFELVSYNGENGQVHQTKKLNGTIQEAECGFGVISYLMPELQNGPSDGIALLFDPSNGGCSLNGKNLTVYQFLSYEGIVVASNGKASGLTSVDVVVEETGHTPVGSSLQLTGTGTAYANFSWTDPTTNTMNLMNTGQTFCTVQTLPPTPQSTTEPTLEPTSEPTTEPTPVLTTGQTPQPTPEPAPETTSPPTADSISGFVWNDLDGDGMAEPGELGIPSVAVLLTDDTNGNGVIDDTGDTPLKLVQTDSGGAYSFEDLEPGNYVVSVIAIQPELNGLVLTTSSAELAASLVLGGSVGDLNFGYATAVGPTSAPTTGSSSVPTLLPIPAEQTLPPTPQTTTEPTSKPTSEPSMVPTPGRTLEPTLEPTVEPTQVPTTKPTPESPSLPTTDSISGFVWNDLDGDGMAEPGEVGIGNVVVSVANDTNGNGVLELVQTDSGGAYAFEDLEPGNYVVSVPDGQPVLNGFGLTTPNTELPASIILGGSVGDLNFGYATVVLNPVPTPAPSSTLTFPSPLHSPAPSPLPSVPPTPLPSPFTTITPTAIPSPALDCTTGYNLNYLSLLYNGAFTVFVRVIHVINSTLTFIFDDFVSPGHYIHLIPATANTLSPEIVIIVALSRTSTLTGHVVIDLGDQAQVYLNDQYGDFIVSLGISVTNQLLCIRPTDMVKLLELQEAYMSQNNPDEPNFSSLCVKCSGQLIAVTLQYNGFSKIHRLEISSRTNTFIISDEVVFGDLIEVNITTPPAPSKSSYSSFQPSQELSLQINAFNASSGTTSSRHTNTTFHTSIPLLCSNKRRNKNTSIYVGQMYSDYRIVGAETLAGRICATFSVNIYNPNMYTNMIEMQSSRRSYSEAGCCISYLRIKLQNISTNATFVGVISNQELIFAEVVKRNQEFELWLNKNDAKNLVFVLPEMDVISELYQIICANFLSVDRTKRTSQNVVLPISISRHLYIVDYLKSPARRKFQIQINLRGVIK